MASASIAAFSPPPSPLPFHRRLRPTTTIIYCSSSSSNNGDDTSPLLRIAVSGVTELLRLVTPKITPSRSGNCGGEEEEEEVAVRCVDDVVSILRSDYANAYFLTGNFTPDVYAKDCLFEDPTIRFRGKDQYARNLELLVPFFDRPSLELKEIEKGVNHDMEFVLAAWKLRTYLRLPWRPLILIDGTTTYDLNRKLQIVRHAESWKISALEAVGQIFTPSRKEDELI